MLTIIVAIAAFLYVVVGIAVSLVFQDQGKDIMWSLVATVWAVSLPVLIIVRAAVIIRRDLAAARKLRA